jgi:hypothetical protein
MNQTEPGRTAGDSTPAFTRMVLIATLITTAAMLAALTGDSSGDGASAGVAFALWLFTTLFVLRVGGQVLVALGPRSWLPPMAQWNLIPYRLLLPIQIVFIVVMVWIDIEFTRGAGIATADVPGFGRFLIVFSGAYALAMAIRYVVRMSRRPDQRWFGGTIPIVFHFVLASYLYVLGSVYAG